MQEDGFVTFEVPERISAALKTEARAQESGPALQSPLQSGRVATNWSRTESSIKCVLEAVELVRPMAPTFFSSPVTVVGVQDIRARTPQDQGFHQDCRGRKNSLTIAIDTDGRGLATDFVTGTVRTVRRSDRVLLTDWVFKNNQTLSNMRRPSRARPPVNCPSIHRVATAGVAFDPSIYHRGTAESSTGHRVFIQLRHGTGGHVNFARSNKITDRWLIPC